MIVREPIDLIDILVNKNLRKNNLLRELQTMFGIQQIKFFLKNSSKNVYMKIVFVQKTRRRKKLYFKD